MPVDNKFELIFTGSDHGGKTEIIQLSCDNVNAPRKLAPCRLANLTYKWIRNLYRCWQTRTPYDESVYLNALKRRGGSPLIADLATTRQSH